MKLVTHGVPMLLAALLAFGHAQAPTRTSTRHELGALEAAVKQDPQSVAAWVALGNYRLNQYLSNTQGNRRDHLENAKSAYLEAIALDYLAADAHFGLGLSEYARGDYQAALFAFNVMARFFSDRFDGHFNRAVTLMQLRQYDDAVAAFEQALAEAEPEASVDDKVEAYLGLADAHKTLGNFDAAADAYGAAIALRGSDSELVYLQSDALYHAERGLEALPLLTDLEVASNDYRVSALIADIYVAATQSDYALRSLERALRKATTAADRPGQASVLVKLGLLQRALGRSEDAKTSFTRAAADDPKAWQALYNLGVSALEEGRPGDAADHLTRAKTIKSDSGELLLALATAHDQLGHTAAALESAQTALTRLSDMALITNASFIVGRATYRQGDYGAALMMLEGVVAEQPDNAQAQLWTGLSAYQLGDYRVAAQYYERAVQLDPGSVTARVNLGAAYLAAQQYADAEQVYTLLTEQNPGDIESFYNLGWARYALNRREDARQAWKQAADLGSAAAQVALKENF